MNKKKLVATLIAGVMIVGGFGVYASNMPKEEAETVRAVMYTKAIKAERVTDPSQIKDGVKMKVGKIVASTPAIGGQGSKVIDLEDFLVISDLSNELQDKLIERHGDLAFEMYFIDVEDAEAIANGDASSSILKAKECVPAKGN